MGGQHRREIILAAITASLSLFLALWVSALASLYWDPVHHWRRAHADSADERTTRATSQCTAHADKSTHARAAANGAAHWAPLPPGELLATSSSGGTRNPAAASTPRSGTEPRTSATAAAPRCSRDLRLLASVVNVTHPEHSFAAVRAGGGTYMLHIGAHLGEMELIALHPTRAYFRPTRGALCRLPVFLPAGERSPAPPPPRAPADAGRKKRKSTLSPAELAAGVRALGGDRFAISRGLLQRALQNPAGIRKSVSLRVRTQNGRVEGFELAALRAGSPFEYLGLRAGDVLRSLNGHDLRDPSGALSALGMIRNADRATLAVLRNGSPKTIEYFAE